MAQVIQTTTARASTRAWSGMPWRLRARPTWLAQGTWCGRGQPTKCHSAHGMPADQDDEQGEGGETLGDPGEAGHGCRALFGGGGPGTRHGEVVDAGQGEDLGELADGDGHGDLLAVDRDGADVPGRGEVVLGIGGGLGGVEGDLAGGSIEGDVDGLGAGAGCGLGVVDGLDLGREGEAAVEDEAGHDDQGDGEDDDERGDHPGLGFTEPAAQAGERSRSRAAR